VPTRDRPAGQRHQEVAVDAPQLDRHRRRRPAPAVIGTHQPQANMPPSARRHATVIQFGHQHRHPATGRHPHGTERRTVQAPDTGKAPSDLALHNPPTLGDGLTGKLRRRNRDGRACPDPRSRGAGGHAAAVLAAAREPGGPFERRRGGGWRAAARVWEPWVASAGRRATRSECLFWGFLSYPGLL
jgi:hypothetical protein